MVEFQRAADYSISDSKPLNKVSKKPQGEGSALGVSALPIQDSRNLR